MTHSAQKKPLICSFIVSRNRNMCSKKCSNIIMICSCTRKIHNCDIYHSGSQKWKICHSQLLIGWTIFSCVKSVVHGLSLARNDLHTKFYNMAFSWVCLSMKNNKVQYVAPALWMTCYHPYPLWVWSWCILNLKRQPWLSHAHHKHLCTGSNKKEGWWQFFSFGCNSHTLCVATQNGYSRTPASGHLPLSRHQSEVPAISLRKLCIDNLP